MTGVSFGNIWEGIAVALPGAVAIRTPEGPVSYAEFDDRASRLAAAMRQAGAGPGSKVACYLFNGRHYLETVFAAFKLGAVPVNANYRYRGAELSELLTDADAEVLVYSAELADAVAHAAARVGTLRLLLRVGDGDVEEALLSHRCESVSTSAHVPQPAVARWRSRSDGPRPSRVDVSPPAAPQARSYVRLRVRLQSPPHWRRPRASDIGDRTGLAIADP